MSQRKSITFKQLYHQLREKGYTSSHIMEEMAKATHSSKATVRNWVYADRIPSKPVCHALADHYEVSVRRLFPRKDIIND